MTFQDPSRPDPPRSVIPLFLRSAAVLVLPPSCTSPAAKARASSRPTVAWQEQEFPVLPGTRAARSPLGTMLPKHPVPARGSPAPRRAAPATSKGRVANIKKDVMQVPSSAVPELIGKRGCIISAIKGALHVEIGTSQGTGPNTTAFTLVGKAEHVEKAKDSINSIMMYYHHEITHPGLVHEELHVEEWSYKFIIGKLGLGVRHIEQSHKVRVRIPRDGAPNRNVVVVGEKCDVERAAAYIRNLIANVAVTARSAAGGPAAGAPASGSPAAPGAPGALR